MEKSEIIESVQAANAYIKKLSSLSNEVIDAQKQIVNTCTETNTNIHQLFSNLKSSLVKILDDKEKSLKEEANNIKLTSLKPLDECLRVINKKIEFTKELCLIGQSLLNGTSTQNNFELFSQHLSELGSLPEVPDLKEVPFLSFHYDSESKEQIISLCESLGQVSKIGPIQIFNVTEKPGGILVEWHNVDEEKFSDVQAYKLQMAFGNVIKDNHLVRNFKDCYEGSESSFLIKDLRQNQIYSFRVCCNFEGENGWSPWSLTQTAVTTIPGYSWKPNKDYLLSNDNKIARPLTDKASILFSNGPQFLVGDAIDFTFLEADKSDGQIGLICRPLEEEARNIADFKENSFFINSSGKITIDGSEKITKLPEFAKGLKVGFSCDPINNNKVLIHVDLQNKRVSYEWGIVPGSAMFFACQFPTPNWSLIVE